MPVCPKCGYAKIGCLKCGYEFEEMEDDGEQIAGRIIEEERKIVVKRVPQGQAIGCLYCLDCRKFRWGQNRCGICGGTNIALHSGSCAVEDYKKGIR